MNPQIIFGIINLAVLSYLIYDIADKKKRKTYAIILNRDEVTKDYIRVNPSLKKFDYDNKTYTIPKTPFIKVLNIYLLLYEENNPKPLELFGEDAGNNKIYADVLREILKMEKIKKLNEVKEGIDFSKYKKYIIIGVILIIGIFVYLNGGV